MLIKDGRLVFPDTTAFKSALLTIDKADRNVLANWESTNQFQSLHTERQMLERQLETLTDKEQINFALKKREAFATISDPSFEHLLNKDGYIQVGDRVYRFTPDNYVLETGESNIGLLTTEKGYNNNVKRTEIQSNTVSHTQKIDPKTGQKASRIAAPDEEITPLNGDHRMVWGYKQENYVVYSTAIALTQCQYYQTYVLRPNEWRISTDAQVGVNVSYARIYYWIGGQESWVTHNNVSDYSTSGSAFFRLGYAGGTGAITQVAEIHATHTLTWNGISKTFNY